MSPEKNLHKNLKPSSLFLLSFHTKKLFIFSLINLLIPLISSCPPTNSKASLFLIFQLPKGTKKFNTLHIINVKQNWVVAQRTFIQNCCQHVVMLHFFCGLGSICFDLLTKIVSDMLSNRNCLALM